MKLGQKDANNIQGLSFGFLN